MRLCNCGKLRRRRGRRKKDRCFGGSHFGGGFKISKRGVIFGQNKKRVGIFNCTSNLLKGGLF